MRDAARRAGTALVKQSYPEFHSLQEPLTLALTPTLTLTRYALSEGRFLPASCDGSRGGQVRPEERDEEAERLAGPQPSDGSDG